MFWDPNYVNFRNLKWILKIYSVKNWFFVLWNNEKVIYFVINVFWLLFENNQVNEFNTTASLIFSLMETLCITISPLPHEVCFFAIIAQFCMYLPQFTWLLKIICRLQKYSKSAVVMPHFHNPGTIALIVFCKFRDCITVEAPSSHFIFWCLGLDNRGSSCCVSLPRERWCLRLFLINV